MAATLKPPQIPPMAVPAGTSSILYFRLMVDGTVSAPFLRRDIALNSSVYILLRWRVRLVDFGEAVTESTLLPQRARHCPLRGHPAQVPAANDALTCPDDS